VRVEISLVTWMKFIFFQQILKLQSEFSDGPWPDPSLVLTHSK